MKILILGSTGAAGSSLLNISSNSPAAVSEIRTITRQARPKATPREVNFKHENLLDYAPVSEAFAGLDACYFCIGRAISLVKDKTEYRTLTFDAAESAAREFHARSPQGVFHYLSGRGASAQSRQLWARVKGEAERALMDKYGAVCWRPGVIDSKQTSGWPAFYKWLIPIMRLIAPLRTFYVTGDDLARAMLEAGLTYQQRRILENREIRDLADQFRVRP